MMIDSRIEWLHLLQAQCLSISHHKLHNVLHVLWGWCRDTWRWESPRKWTMITSTSYIGFNSPPRIWVILLVGREYYPNVIWKRLYEAMETMLTVLYTHRGCVRGWVAVECLSFNLDEVSSVNHNHCHPWLVRFGHRQPLQVVRKTLHQMGWYCGQWGWLTTHILNLQKNFKKYTEAMR